MYTDPLADYLTRIRNANSAGHRVVSIPASNLKKKSQKYYSIKDTSLATSLKSRTTNKEASRLH